jgi:hypothetical protein
MRTQFVSSLCRIGFALTLVFTAQAQAAEPSRGADMLRLLGFDVAVSGYADQIKNSPTGVEGQDRDFETAREDLIDELFQPELLFGAVVDRVDGAFSDTDYDQLEAYFSKGVGLRVTEAEKQAQSEPQGDERDVVRLIAIEDLLENNPERLDQISQMIVSMDLVGSGSAMAMNIGYALISGMASTGQLPGDPSDERILGMLNAQRGQIEERIFDKSVESLAYTYREISDGDLDDYIAFLDSDLGQKLYNVLNSALVEVLTTATRKFGHDLMLRSGVREL